MGLGAAGEEAEVAGRVQETAAEVEDGGDRRTAGDEAGGAGEGAADQAVSAEPE